MPVAYSSTGQGVWCCIYWLVRMELQGIDVPASCRLWGVELCVWDIALVYKVLVYMETPNKVPYAVKETL